MWPHGLTQKKWFYAVSLDLFQYFVGRIWVPYERILQTSQEQKSSTAFDGKTTTAAARGLRRETKRQPTIFGHLYFEPHLRDCSKFQERKIQTSCLLSRPSESLCAERPELQGVQLVVGGPRLPGIGRAPFKGLMSCA